MVEEIEQDNYKKWLQVSAEDREKTFKYLKLLKRFAKNPDWISKDHKRWILKHVHLPTDLVPLEEMDGHWL